jgi:hypothetical protein
MAFTGPQPENTPKILYKYRYFDDKGYHLQNLSNAELRFNSANHFNDPFDSAIEFDLEGIDSDIAIQMTENIVKRKYPQLGPLQQRKLAEEITIKIKNDPSHVSSFQQSQINNNYDRFGICALTPYKDNLLMWAHYAKDHSGFCFGIDTEKLLELQHQLIHSNNMLDLHEVIYLKEMPKINLFKFMLSPDGEQELMRMVTTKSIDWYYEHEYRLIYWNHPNISLPIGSNAIAEIILGCRIKPEDKSDILSTIRKSNYKSKVYQAVKHKKMFELEFQPISY